MIHKLVSQWYKPSLTVLTVLLLPFSWLFRLVVCLRRWVYQRGWLLSHQFPVPVIVVGNLTVGGTGKTPLVLFLAEFLKASGFNPGIVMRGYKGEMKTACFVNKMTPVSQVGDEAVLLAGRLNVPVVVGANRVDAVRYLLKNSACDLVISDDGLQHYALARDIEIVVIDGMRRLGNGQSLPAGPLREMPARLASVDFIVTNGEAHVGEYSMHMIAEQLCSVSDFTHRVPLTEFSEKKVHAIAGIGNPERFFQTLHLKGFSVIPHVFKDHHHFVKSDIDFDGPVIMTEKDAVKCREFADERHWFLPVNARLPESFCQFLLEKVKEKEV